MVTGLFVTLNTCVPPDKVQLAAKPPFDPFPNVKPLTLVKGLESPTFAFPITPLPDNVNVSEPTKFVIVDKSEDDAVVVAL